MHYFYWEGAICRPLVDKSSFLLDNDAPLAHEFNWTELYEDRKSFGRNFSEKLDWNGKGGLLWDSEKVTFWKLNKTADFIEQFNFVGFQDICNYPMIIGWGTNFLYLIFLR